MDKKQIAVIVIIACIVLSGCVGSGNTTTYHNDGCNTLHLMSDGTYVVYQTSGRTFHGDYAKVGDELFLKYAVLGTDECSRLMLIDSCYVDHEGDQWVPE